MAGGLPSRCRCTSCSRREATVVYSEGVPGEGTPVYMTSVPYLGHVLGRTSASAFGLSLSPIILNPIETLPPWPESQITSK